MTAFPQNALSPWGMPPQERLHIAPLNRPLDATLALPGSKSFTNRALILAAVAQGTSTLKSPLYSDDSYWCCEALGHLGVAVQSNFPVGDIRIAGAARFEAPQDNVFIGSAGTTARFLPGLIAARGVGKIRLHATPQLAGRPIAELVEALRTLGAEIVCEEKGKSFPMTIGGGTLRGGCVSITGKKSSQFISGLLMAGPLAQQETIIEIPDEIVQQDYVRITLALMRDFGVEVQAREDLRRFVIAPQEYKAANVTLEADASTATYFFALAAVTGGRVCVTNLDPRTHQPDIEFLDHLVAMGCRVKKEGTQITLHGPKKLKSGRLFDLNSCSDSTPALAAIAPFADGVTEIRGVGHIRTHESDRIRVLCENLSRAGIKVVEHDDGLTITPGLPACTEIHPHDDHRMSMAFSVMAAAGKGAVMLEPACVSKTCPDYYRLISELGVKIA